jgi:hypothetical protein
MNPSATGHSRQNPSPRYVELLDLYRRMHVEGEPASDISADETFPGRSLYVHAASIKEMIDRTGARTLLDYGAGKGQQYARRDFDLADGRRVESLQGFWGVDSVTLYDPAYTPHSGLPEGPFDGVICTDVLEHCPEADVPWIIEELFGYARKFVYGNIACHLAKSVLPNGENAHCTARPESWWRPLLTAIAGRHPQVRYRFVLETRYRNLLGIKKRKKVPVVG